MVPGRPGHHGQHVVERVLMELKVEQERVAIQVLNTEVCIVKEILMNPAYAY